MKIVIPTLNRVNTQHTYESLRGTTYPVLIACPPEEALDHILAGRDNILETPMQGIAPTRQYIMETVEDDIIVMMDDDLKFAKRRTDEPTKFLPNTVEDTQEMLEELEYSLQLFAHAGISMREGANYDVNPHLYCARCARVIGFYKPIFLKERVDFRNNMVMDDFEAALHLITRGYQSIILNNWVQNQVGSGTIGGAETYRTREMHAASAKLLQKRYPRYVKLVEKTTKVAWGGGTRTDVRVQWKKAFQEAIQ